MDQVLEGLMLKMQNEGEPVFPRYLFGDNEHPEGEPKTEPRTGVNEISSNFQIVLESRFREEQEQLFDAVDQFLERHA